MKFLKSVAIILLVMFSVTTVVPVIGTISLAAGEEEISVFIDGQRLYTDVPPIIVEGRTLVPARAVLEAFGFTMEWDDSKKTVKAYKPGYTLWLEIGNKQARYANGAAYAGSAGTLNMDVAPSIVDGRTLVPLRFIAEDRSADVSWDGESRTVDIMSFQRKLAIEAAKSYEAIPQAELSRAKTNLEKVGDYLQASANQVVLGKYTEDCTELGTASQVLAGFVGVDLPADIRDITHDLQHWKWSWGHAGETALDALGFLPIVGGIKNAKKATKFADGASGVGKGTVNTANKIVKFKGDEAVAHFERHGKEMMDVLGKSEYNLKNYVDDANFVVKNGQFVPELNGYVRLLGGQGSAKYGFVGLDRATGNLTTFHVKTVSELVKKAPSLGLTK